MTESNDQKQPAPRTERCSSCGRPGCTDAHEPYYNQHGDKVLLAFYDCDPDGPYEYIVLRNEDSIHEELARCKDKVWWNSHRRWTDRIKSGEEALDPTQRDIFASAEAGARAIEAKYGLDDLLLDDYEWGVLCGKLSALGWVTGRSWEESMDT